MKKLLLFVLSLMVTIAPFSLYAEQTAEVDYKPQLFGAVRAKYEQSVVNGEHRFNVRNSRIGVKGNASESVRYAVQIDFNNEGSVSILDSYVAYKMDNLELSLGQQQYHFSADLDRGPTSSLFSNRSFIAKYLTTYYGNKDGADFVKTIGSRDIGVVASYKLSTNFAPIAITAGLMNGSGANNPEWTEGVNFVSRVAVGASRGFQVAASVYTGVTPFVDTVTDGSITSTKNQYINMYGGELRYAGELFLIEAAYAQRQLKVNDDRRDLNAAHIHGYYRFNLTNNRYANYLAPHLRFDTGRGIEFINDLTDELDRYSADRITVALNIGLSEKWMRSELRISYEEYMVRNKPSDYSVNPLLQDKYTIELIAAF